MLCWFCKLSVSLCSYVAAPTIRELHLLSIFAPITEARFCYTDMFVSRLDASAGLQRDAVYSSGYAHTSRNFFCATLDAYRALCLVLPCTAPLDVSKSHNQELDVIYLCWVFALCQCSCNGLLQRHTAVGTAPGSIETLQAPATRASRTDR